MIKDLLNYTSIKLNDELKFKKIENMIPVPVIIQPVPTIKEVKLIPAGSSSPIKRRKKSVTVPNEKSPLELSSGAWALSNTENLSQSKNMQSLYEHPPGLNYFRSFLKRIYCDENLSFIEVIDDFDTDTCSLTEAKGVNI